MKGQVAKERLCVNPRMPKGPSGNPLPKRNNKERMDHNTMPKTTTTEMPARPSEQVLLEKRLEKRYLIICGFEVNR